MKGVTVKESPEWLQNKLRIIGLRPINNVVDITNYIVHAFGQPLHCFDADQIKGGEVVVKTMPEGTPFVTLDGVVLRKLPKMFSLKALIYIRHGFVRQLVVMD